eukprot:SAG31_NODE_15132_length_769_cov_0.692537_2_plen_197_part_00
MKFHFFVCFLFFLFFAQTFFQKLPAPDAEGHFVSAAAARRAHRARCLPRLLLLLLAFVIIISVSLFMRFCNSKPRGRQCSPPAAAVAGGDQSNPALLAGPLLPRRRSASRRQRQRRSAGIGEPTWPGFAAGAVARAARLLAPRHPAAAGGTADGAPRSAGCGGRWALRNDQVGRPGGPGAAPSCGPERQELVLGGS